MGNDCARCNKYIAAKSAAYAPTISRIRKKCNLDIKCDNLGEEDGYEMRIDSPLNPFTRIHILIVIDCCVGASEDFNSPEDTFGHELTHALDACYKRDSGSSCEDSICKEIRAYTIGGCKGLTGNNLLTCLKDRVPGSSEAYCGNDEDKMQRMVEQYFEKCIKGYPH